MGRIQIDKWFRAGDQYVPGPVWGYWNGSKVFTLSLGKKNLFGLFPHGEEMFGISRRKPKDMTEAFRMGLNYLRLIESNEREEQLRLAFNAHTGKTGYVPQGVRPEPIRTMPSGASVQNTNDTRDAPRARAGACGHWEAVYRGGPGAYEELVAAHGRDRVRKASHPGGPNFYVCK